MKPKELKLDQLKVDSFVTSIDENNEHTIKGGLFTLTINQEPTALCSAANCPSNAICPSDTCLTTKITVIDPIDWGGTWG